MALSSLVLALSSAVVSTFIFKDLFMEAASLLYSAPIFAMCCVLRAIKAWKRWSGALLTSNTSLPVSRAISSFTFMLGYLFTSDLAAVWSAVGLTTLPPNVRTPNCGWYWFVKVASVVVSVALLPPM
ncbi:hypothetical protein D3C84_926000 [compost metagenome]